MLWAYKDKASLIFIKPEKSSCVPVRRLLISQTAAGTYHRAPFTASRLQRDFKLTCQIFLNNIPVCPTQYQPPTNLASCACVSASDWSFLFFLPPTPTPLQAKAHRLRRGQCTSATCLSVTLQAWLTSPLSETLCSTANQVATTASQMKGKF